MAEQHLAEGMKIRILKEEEVIDEAIIKYVLYNGDELPDEIRIESLKLNPGKTFEFGFIQHIDLIKKGWRMLFEDPFTGSQCFSQRAPTYTFEPVQDAL